MNRSKSILEEVNGFQALMQEWRRDIHQHPELAFNENRTAELVTQNLESFGIEVFTGIGKTGVVGTINPWKFGSCRWFKGRHGCFTHAREQ